MGKGDCTEPPPRGRFPFGPSTEHCLPACRPRECNAVRPKQRLKAFRHAAKQWHTQWPNRASRGTCAITLRAENPKSYTTLGKPDPYPAIFNGTPAYAILNGFPWDRLQFLPMDYGKPSASK